MRGTLLRAAVAGALLGLLLGGVAGQPRPARLGVDLDPRRAEPGGLEVTPQLRERLEEVGPVQVVRTPQVLVQAALVHG